jgi:CO/xanthine dehydrogenase FAD-binding subunit
MKFPRFSYTAPTTVEEALEALASSDDARALAGGQSLLPLMAFRLSRPSLLVDLSRIDELKTLQRRDSTMFIGAMVRQAECEKSTDVAAALPVLADAIQYLAHPAIRTCGTIGGSIAHADPAAELPVVMTALDATMIVRSAVGERAVPAGEFFQGHFTTAMESGELLTRIDVPVSDLQWGFAEVARRHADFAIAMAAVGLRIEDGQCTHARVALGGIADRPTPAAAAEELLVGATIDGELAERAARAAVEGTSPPSDVHGSTEYRRQVARVVARRAIEQAAGGRG